MGHSTLKFFTQASITFSKLFSRVFDFPVLLSQGELGHFCSYKLSIKKSKESYLLLFECLWSTHHGHSILKFFIQASKLFSRVFDFLALLSQEELGHF